SHVRFSDQPGGPSLRGSWRRRSSVDDRPSFASRHIRGRVLSHVRRGTTVFHATDGHTTASTSRLPPSAVGLSGLQRRVPLHTGKAIAEAPAAEPWPNSRAGRRPVVRTTPNDALPPASDPAAMSPGVSPDAITSVDVYGQA